MGINQGLQPIISYNYGARHSDRIKQALKLALIYTTIIGAIGSLVGILFPTMAIRLFVKDKQLISEATFVLRIQLLFYWTIGLQMVASTFYQSIGSSDSRFVFIYSKTIHYLNSSDLHSSSLYFSWN